MQHMVAACTIGFSGAYYKNKDFCCSATLHMVYMYVPGKKGLD